MTKITKLKQSSVSQQTTNSWFTGKRPRGPHEILYMTTRGDVGTKKEKKIIMIILELIFEQLITAENRQGGMDKRDIVKSKERKEIRKNNINK